MSILLKDSILKMDPFLIRGFKMHNRLLIYVLHVRIKLLLQILNIGILSHYYVKVIIILKLRDSEILVNMLLN
jgi:hypothetical protein